MKRYLYNYQTILTFSAPVINHSVLLRCQPMNTNYQRVEEEHVVFTPHFKLNHAADSFGNRIIYGGRRDAHASFCYVSVGIVAVADYHTSEPWGISPIYLLPTPRTTLPIDISVERTDDFTTDVMEICSKVNKLIDYVPSATTVETSVKDVLKLHKGVCQDYAHLMIALCRRLSLPARYVCGFMEGTGQTHAWVEVFDGKAWWPFDPTNNIAVTTGYVKVAHGRDAADCPVCRGLYAGYVAQDQQITVTLKEL